METKAGHGGLVGGSVAYVRLSLAGGGDSRRPVPSVASGSRDPRRERRRWREGARELACSRSGPAPPRSGAVGVLGFGRAGGGAVGSGQ